ncbi:MAG: peptidoglycan DD-metalloendopeptidase family protein, partial [Proteobacteria bacterium]|nr:peptidoglycan DD-metalloendopeptidase family protein [Pseudomonadota bacterium]
MKIAKNLGEYFSRPYSVGAILMMVVVLAAIAGTVFLSKKRTVAAATASCETALAVQSGDTLSKILAAQGFSGSDINAIAATLKAKANIAGLRANSDQLIVSRLNPGAAPDKIILICGPWKQVEIHRVDGPADGAGGPAPHSLGVGGWDAHVIETERDTRIVRRTGVINDGDSFYGAGIRAGIPDGVIMTVYDLLSFDIDFERDLRPNQKFSVMYEEQFADGERKGNGSVVQISFDSRRGNLKMYRFKKADGTFGYYDENGNGAIKSIKRTPINNARVTSGFSMHRLHPLLGYTRAHKGVDFGAAMGTPIPAACMGVVVEKKYNGGYGNYITVKCNATFATRYGHMSKFQGGVGVGTRVRLGQIIGYVGSTGMSTGPHLHYEIIQN